MNGYCVIKENRWYLFLKSQNEERNSHPKFIFLLVKAFLSYAKGCCIVCTTAFNCNTQQNLTLDVSIYVFLDHFDLVGSLNVPAILVYKPSPKARNIQTLKILHFGFF